MSYKKMKVSELKPGHVFLHGNTHAKVVSVSEPHGHYQTVRAHMENNPALVANLRKKHDSLVAVTEASIKEGK